jgi:hypothetical protein
LRHTTFNGVSLKGTQLCGAQLPDPKHPTLASGNFECTTAWRRSTPSRTSRTATAKSQSQ